MRRLPSAQRRRKRISACPFRRRKAELPRRSSSAWGRAIGEAMAVMMVSGNAPNMPELFQSVRFLTTAVASEMSYSSGLQRQALFSIALVLFLFIMLINATLNFLLKRDKSNG